MHLKKRDGAPYRTVFIGAGPAGIGPLVCAVQKGTFAQLLDSDIAVLDATNIIGRGAIGQYVINSDTLSNTFLECLRNQGGGPLAPLLTAESTHAIQQHADGPAPLRLVGDYMADLGQAVRRAIDAHPASQFLARTTAQSITLNRDGTLTTHARWTDDEGSTHMLGLQSTNVVVATGGVQSLPRVLSAIYLIYS